MREHNLSTASEQICYNDVVSLTRGLGGGENYSYIRVMAEEFLLK